MPDSAPLITATVERILADVGRGLIEVDAIELAGFQHPVQVPDKEVRMSTLGADPSELLKAALILNHPRDHIPLGLISQVRRRHAPDAVARTVEHEFGAVTVGVFDFVFQPPPIPLGYHVSPVRILVERRISVQKRVAGFPLEVAAAYPRICG